MSFRLLTSRAKVLPGDSHLQREERRPMMAVLLLRPHEVHQPAR